MRLLFVSLIVLSLGNYAFALTQFEHGVLPIQCGNKSVNVEYRISFDAIKPVSNKFAILIDGSPTTKFFSDNGNDYYRITSKLRAAGYKIFELRYPKTSGEPWLGAQGFYSACYHQGLDNIYKHSADLYDGAIQKLGYQPHNPSHEMVALGYSIGAVLVQAMAFTNNKKFDRIALTGVMVGDAVRGCQDGLKQLARLREVPMSIEPNDFCKDEAISGGTSWAAFMELAQLITKSGNGCCIEKPNEFGSCSAGTKNEYTNNYNFEEQPYFANSNLAMFEGDMNCLHPDLFNNIPASNMAQVNYIAAVRAKKNAKTKIFSYPGVGHTIINLAGERAVKDIIDFLAPGAY